MFTSNGHDFVLPRMSLLECTNSCIFPRKTVLFYLEIHTYFHIQTINIEQKGNVYKMYKKIRLVELFNFKSITYIS